MASTAGAGTRAAGRRGEHKGLEQVDRCGAGAVGVFTSYQQDPQGFPVAVTAWLGVHRSGESFPRGQACIGRVGLSAGSAADSFRSASLYDVLSGCEQAPQETGAVRAAAFHSPRQTGPGCLLYGPVEQGGVAIRRGLHGDGGQLAAGGIEEAGGMRVGVGVHADDGIGGVCEHGHAAVAPSQRRRLTLAPAWVETPTAHL